MAEARSKSSKNSTNCVLPEELVFNVLTLLPVISLLRFKSVCKSWLSIISNPQFIQTHLIESHKKQPSSVLKVVDKSIYVDTCETSTLLHVLGDFYGWIDSVCSCNGLVCLANRFADVIYLLNPMTKRFKKLPTPTEQPDCEEVLIGLGFDDISNDYKILRIAPTLRLINDDDDDVVCSLEVEMYSANNDSWKEIQVPETLEYFSIYRNVCVNLKGCRVLYIEGTYELLSFDLHDEVFRVYPYPIPISLVQFEQRNSFVLDFEGSVAMIFNESINDGVSTLWRLDDVCGNWSWTKVFNLEHSLKKYPVTSLYLGDGKFFARDADAGEYIFCDYKKKHDRKFLRTPCPTIGSIVKYNESLVSLKGFEQLE